jgi:hypothetical protein
VSKERARRREQREREAAERSAALAAARRRVERRRALVAPVTGPWRRIRLALTTGQQTGPLAQRRRTRIRLIVAVLFFAQVVVWVLRPDWQARLAALVFALFAFPVVAVFAL